MSVQNRLWILRVDDQLALQAFECYVVQFLSHGGDDIELMGADMLWSSSFGLMDPAVWSDLLESLWTTVGIAWLGPRIDLSNTATLPDGSSASVTVQSSVNTAFVPTDQSPATMSRLLSMGDWTELDVLSAIRLVVWWYGVEGSSLHTLLDRIRAARAGRDAGFTTIWGEALRAPLDRNGVTGRTTSWTRDKP